MNNMNDVNARRTRFAASAAFVCVALLLSCGGTHGYKYELYAEMDCAGTDTSTYTDMTYADGSAFTGEFLLDTCYGVSEKNGSTVQTTYLYGTYDADMNSVTYTEYNTSTCKADSAEYTTTEMCGKCMNFCTENSYSFNSTSSSVGGSQAVKCSNGDSSWKVTGCPTPPAKKPPTTVKPDTYVWVNYDDEYCTEGAKPSDPHWFQILATNPSSGTTVAQEKKFIAAGYSVPLNTCYTSQHKEFNVTDDWTTEQCIDTYDPIAHTLNMKCYTNFSSTLGDGQCDSQWVTPTMDETKKCNLCDKGELILCPQTFPLSTQKLDTVPAGKYARKKFKGPGCTGELSAIDPRTLQNADGTPFNPYNISIGTCYSWRYKVHPSDATWSYEYYVDTYDPVTHSMKSTAHNSPTCDDESSSYSEGDVCDKCVELCDGGWCQDYAATVDGTISSSYMISGCPAPPPSPPLLAKPPPPKSSKPEDNLAAAKEEAKKKQDEADEKKKIADDKKALADEKKQDAEAIKKKADDAREAIVAKIADKKVAVEVKVVAAAAAAGVKIKMVSAPLDAPDAETACATMCAAAKVDCANNVLCSAELRTGGSARHLLAGTFTTTLAMPGDASEASSVEDNLKAAGTTPTVTEEDPLKRLNDLSMYLPAEVFAELKTTTLAASVAKTEADEASAAAVTALEESAAADEAAEVATNDVTAAEKEVMKKPPPPPPPPPVVVRDAPSPAPAPPPPVVQDDDSSAPGSVFRKRFVAVALTAFSSAVLFLL